jgi:two-component system phosphate regulon response regulator PhoB
MTNERVLLVDDDEDLSELLRYSLESEGFHTSAASDADEALLVADGINPSLVLVDHQLADGRAEHLLRRLKRGSRTEAVPVLLLSSDAGARDWCRAADGPDAVLAKPFSPRTLVELVRQMLWFRSARVLAPVG